jgi:hypothetical protein
MTVVLVAGCGDSSSNRTGSPVPTASATATAAAGPTATAEVTEEPWPTTTPGPGAFTVAIGARPGSSWTVTPVVLPDGRVLFLGAGISERDYTGRASSDVVFYNPADGTVNDMQPFIIVNDRQNSLIYDRPCALSVLLKDGRVLVAGGSYTTAAAELYDPAAGKSSATGAVLAQPESPCMKGVLLGNGEVLIPGWIGMPRIQLYSPTTGYFRWGPAMLTKADNRTVTVLPDGRVLFAGGGENAGMGITVAVFAKAELYDPATGKFTATGSMAHARQEHVAALLPDGRVLIVGGSDLEGKALNTAEIWDPKTGKFTATGSMTSARDAATATTLKNGKVLVASGYSHGSAPAFAELYDPATGKFTRTGSMAVGRGWSSAVLLNNGCVLISGGSGDGPYAELYWP